MKRHQFCESLGGSAVAPEASRAYLLASALPGSSAVANYADVPAVNPGDTEAYFTEEKLRQAMDTTVPTEGSHSRLLPSVWRVGIPA